jgi:hypothetical protein
MRSRLLLTRKKLITKLSSSRIKGLTSSELSPPDARNGRDPHVPRLALRWAFSVLHWALSVLRWALSALGWALSILLCALLVLRWALLVLRWALSVLRWALSALSWLLLVLMVCLMTHFSGLPVACTPGGGP